MDTSPDDISPLVKKWMPDATDEELREATVNFREFIAVIYRIHLREQAEKQAKKPPDVTKRPELL